MSSENETKREQRATTTCEVFNVLRERKSHRRQSMWRLIVESLRSFDKKTDQKVLGGGAYKNLIDNLLSHVSRFARGCP